jgi:hypothetical protein
LEYGEEYPGCPHCGKKEDLAALSRHEEARRIKDYRVLVTSPGYDDIGKVLRTLKIKHQPFAGSYDCDLLFMNCGSSDVLDAQKIKQFVAGGGCLYASDLTGSFIASAFPGLVTLGSTGNVGDLAVDVIDAELRGIVGSQMKIKFDMPYWQVVAACQGATLLRSAHKGAGADKGIPVMVKIEYGKGLIFYTSFHNHAQASEKEKALLQLLVLRQVGAKLNASLEFAGKTLGVDMEKLKAAFKYNF